MADGMRRSPLESFEKAMRDASWPGARLEPVPFLAQVGLRVTDGGRAKAEATLGATLPGPNRVAASRFGDILWLGPDEWLIVGPDATEFDIETALRASVGTADGAVVGLSASRTGIVLAGPEATTVLSTCCALDLDPRIFHAGDCAQTLLAKAPVLIQGLEPFFGFRLLVRPSFVSYVVGWLVDGMAGVGRVSVSV